MNPNNSGYNASAPPISPPTLQEFEFDNYLTGVSVPKSQPGSYQAPNTQNYPMSPTVPQNSFGNTPQYNIPHTSPYVSPDASPLGGHVSPQPYPQQYQQQPPQYAQQPNYQQQYQHQPPPMGRVSPQPPNNFPQQPHQPMGRISPQNQPVGRVSPQNPTQPNRHVSPQQKTSPQVSPGNAQPPKKKSGYSNLLKTYEEEQLAKQQKLQLGLDDPPPQQNYQYQVIQQQYSDYSTSNIPYHEQPLGNLYPTVEPVQVYHTPIVQAIPVPHQPKPSMNPKDEQLMRKFYPGYKQ